MEGAGRSRHDSSTSAGRAETADHGVASSLSGTTTAAGQHYGVSAHLRADNVVTYRAVMGAFVAAKRRFTMHLRPADVVELVRAAGPGAPSADAVDAALGPLVEWGNLRDHPDTGRVATVEDFHRARYLYQLTAEGEAAERALATFDDALGRRGALQAVALADIATHLRALLALGDDTGSPNGDAASPDAARAQLALDGLVTRFTSLADNAQAFMGSLQRSIDLHGVDAEAFAAYKGRLVDYLERFVADLQTTGAEIAALVTALDRPPVSDPASPRSRIDVLLDLVVAREASDLAPDDAAPSPADDLAWQVELLRATWRERWEGVRAWFLSTPGRPSQAKLLRSQARAAVPALLAVVAALNERRQGRSDRSADFRRLALWFAQAPTDGARHQLWHTAFGLSSARHLSIDADALEAREQEPVPASTSWADAPPLQISPQLRRTGSWERRGRPAAVVDRSEARRSLAAVVEAEASQTRAAREALVSDGPRPLSQLPELDPAAFSLFLSLLATALARTRPGGGRTTATTGDGALAVELEPLPGGGTAAVRTATGVFSGPDHLLWVRDLRPGAPPEHAAPGAADLGAADPGAADPGAADPGAAGAQDAVADRTEGSP